MDQPEASAPSSADIVVREFRETLLFPLELVALPGRAQTEAHWERLMAAETVWRDTAKGLPIAIDERRYAAFVAFMPDIQRFLYGERRSFEAALSGYGASPIHVFRRTDVTHAVVTLSRGAPAITFDIGRIELFFFYDIDLAILAVEFVARDVTLAQAQACLFQLGRAYPTAWDEDGGGNHCCASVELLNAQGEVVAASDYQDKQRYLDSVAHHRAPYIAAHWAYLLDPLGPHHLGGADSILYRQLEQQLIPLLAYLAVDDPRSISRDDWVRLGLTAPPGPPDSSPFGARYIADFEARYCYDRFWDPHRRHDQTTTRMICSGHAFIMVGEAGNPRFTHPDKGVLAKYRQQYFILALIAHFHRATLLGFRERLVSAISGLSDYGPETLKRFRREIRMTQENFLRFTHRYWFEEVSDYGPARDLFNRWTEQLGTARLFAEVREEVNDMIAYLDSDGLRRQANSVVRLTVVTFFGLIGTVATGILGMNLFDLADRSALDRLLWFVAVLVPVAVLTFYTAAKSQRLSEFLEAVSDSRLSLRAKARALLRVWRRG